MILAVLVWCEILAESEETYGASATVAELPGDSNVTPWLLQHWLGVVLIGLHGGHPTLCQWYDLSGIHSGDSLVEKLAEVLCYFRCFGSRGPPSRLNLRAMVRRYSCHTGRHFLGIPSQERTRLSAR